ncbi:MAG: hypothetical protein ACN6PX_03130 [Stenotrophomonas lactitubi]|uniref:hypothetical protein n=1 Tax=Stenotrophomonas lactitubi TaxID=2045214 RepID=UPI003D13AE1B
MLQPLLTAGLSILARTSSIDCVDDSAQGVLVGARHVVAVAIEHMAPLVCQLRPIPNCTHPLRFPVANVAGVDLVQMPSFEWMSVMAESAPTRRSYGN